MSEDERRKRVKKGHSDGAYRASKPHGLTNRFQPSWLKDPNHPLREHWLRDGGLDGNDEYVVECLFCKTTFQSRLQNVKAHENGKKHKGFEADWQQKQKDLAAWQRNFDKGAAYTAQLRAGQTADKKLHTLFASTYKHLQLGRPITDVSAERPITEELKPRMEQLLMDKLSATADNMLNDVSARFPPSELAWAMGCIYPAWWQQAPNGKGKEQLDQALAILNDAFCKSRPLVENAAAAGSNIEVAAPLSFDSLQDQKGVYAAEMQAFVQCHAPSAAAAPEQAVPRRQAATPPPAPARPATLAPSQAASALERAEPMSDRAMRAARRAAQAAQAAVDANPEAPSGSDSESEEPEPEPEQEVQEVAAKPLPKAEAFWQEACRLGASLRYPEFVKLAQLVMVMVPGSVEDERMFSAMKYLKDPQRNRLQEQHLTACARAFKSKEFSIKSFPYPAAIGKWLDASKRGRYGLK
jgi:hypothetical protein